MNSINSSFDLPNQPEYFKNFWDYARGREDSDAFLEAGKKPSEDRNSSETAAAAP